MSARGIAQALGQPLPACVEVGGLASHGVDQTANRERATWFVDRILKGANLAERAIDQPTRLELALNLKTVKAVGIEICQNVRAGDDEVIE